MDLATVILEVARAGATAIAQTSAVQNLDIRTKSGPHDFVTAADLASETAILERIRTTCPDDAVLSEESGEHTGSTGVRWIVDPLDGTANFVHGRPDWAVAVAVRREAPDAVLLGGAIVRPVYGDWVVAGDGVVRGSAGTPRASTTRRLAESLISVGLSTHVASARERNFRLLGALLPRVRDFRRSGSSSCDFFQVATGQLDALVTIDSKPWDLYPGLAVVEAAGGAHRTVTLDNGSRAVVAGAPTVVDELAEIIQGLPYAH